MKPERKIAREEKRNKVPIRQPGNNEIAIVKSLLFNNFPEGTWIKVQLSAVYPRLTSYID
jgi:hypothetical protein